jgi:hypothetical protein
VIHNAVVHPISGKPWKAYNEKEREWIRNKVAFVPILCRGHMHSYVPVSWHDTAKRNISLERIVMLMSGILVEPSCICAAHMLMPLNIVRIPNEQHTILVNPIIIVISDNSSSICFNNNLFQNTHRHGGNAKEASPSDTRHKTMEHKTVLCVGNTKPASAVGSTLTDDKQNVKTSKALTSALESMGRGARLYAAGNRWDDDNNHCELFPRKLLVEYSSYVDSTGSRRRDWLMDRSSACLVHCTNVFMRDTVYTKEGLTVDYYAGIYGPEVRVHQV